ncbi:hypothetical protein SLA2020_526140 [Shorea laevis]
MTCFSLFSTKDACKIRVCSNHSLTQTNRGSRFHPLLNACRSLIQKLEQVRIEHVYREGNGAADALAKHGASMLEPILVFDFIPDFCLASLAIDLAAFDVYRSALCKT